MDNAVIKGRRILEFEVPMPPEGTPIITKEGAMHPDRKASYVRMRIYLVPGEEEKDAMDRFVGDNPWLTLKITFQ